MARPLNLAIATVNEQSMVTISGSEPAM